MGFNKAFEDKKFMIFYVRKLSKINKNKQKEINFYGENETEKYEKLNQKLLNKQLSKDIKIEKLENLAVSKVNEILI